MLYPRVPSPPKNTTAQKLPANLRVGAVLYKASAYCDDECGPVSIDIEEWHVRSIRKAKACDQAPTIYLIKKVDGSTWGKLSKKSGDYGWLPAIPDSCRESFLGGEYMADGFATTKEKALALAVGTVKGERTRYEAWDRAPGSIGHKEAIACCDIKIEALERRRKSLITKKKNARVENKVGDDNVGSQRAAQ